MKHIQDWRKDKKLGDDLGLIEQRVTYCTDLI